MKHLKLFRWTGTLLLGLFFTVTARTVFAESITQFNSTINVDAKGLLTVTEVIKYDFSDAERHGVYRDIPYKYTGQVGSRYLTEVTVQSVTDETGIPYQYTTSHQGSLLRIKIGDPNTLITGQRTYIITYTVKDAIQWFNGEPEIYWNITGNDWTVAIESVSGQLTSDIPLSVDKVKCFTGPSGSTDSNCTIAPVSGTNNIQITTGLVSVGEGLTIAARLPAGSIPEPTRLDRIRKFVGDNWPVVLPVLALILMATLYLKNGRDPRGQGTIIPEYEPPENMSPALLGYIIDEKIDSRDITASILNLAVKGYLKIRYEGKHMFRESYRLEKQKPAGDDLTPFEKQLHEGLFSSGDTPTLSELGRGLARKLPAMKAELIKEAEDKQMIDQKSKQLQTSLTIVGGIILALAIFFGSAWGAIMSVSLLLTGGIILVISQFMTRRTQRGVVAKEHIEGFKRFLRVTEEQRLKFHNAPSRQPKEFMTYLPYAVALGVEKDWAKQFEHLAIAQPDWYTGQSWTMFNAYIFTSSLGDFSRAAQSQAFVSPTTRGSGFGGGGFSGGGFGGGGGGSW